MPTTIFLDEPADRVLCHVADDLALALFRIGHWSKVAASDETPSSADAILIGWRGAGGAIDALVTTGQLALEEDQPGPQGFVLRSQSGRCVIAGCDRLGSFYGVYELVRRIERAGVWPLVVDERSAPVFPVRRLSTLVLQGPFPRHYDERLSILLGIRYIERDLLPLALRLGINSIELTGRPGEGIDLDWLLIYPLDPALNRIYGQDPGALWRREQITDLCQRISSYGLQTYLWTHELHLPEEFITLHPEVAGIDYPVCFSRPEVQGFLRAKFEEACLAFPQIAGFVLSFSESGYLHLLVDDGCRCDECSARGRQGTLRLAVDIIAEVCRTYGRQLVVRTFSNAFYREVGRHTESEILREAYTGLPADVMIMSKYCPQDFFGTQFPDHPLIGAFPGNRELVEFTLHREWSGRTLVPNVTPDDYQRRLRRAHARGIVGCVGRVDFCNPPYETERTLETPNAFNVVAFSRLLWDPWGDLEGIEHEWAVAQYGEQAAPWVISALSRSGDITDRIWYHRGFVVINYHNMIPHVHVCEAAIWQFNIAKWDLTRLPTYEKLERPDDEFLLSLLAEKEEALNLTDAALADLEQARCGLRPDEYARLRYYFEKLREAGQMWWHLTRVFFRHRMLKQGHAVTDLLRAEAAELLAYARQLERITPQTHGFSVPSLGPWPARALERGISASEFVAELYRVWLYAFLGTEAPVQYGRRYGDMQSETLLYAPGSIEWFYRALLALTPRHDPDDGDALYLRIPSLLDQVSLNADGVLLSRYDGARLVLPLAQPVSSLALAGGRAYHLHIEETPAELRVQARKGANS